MTDFSIATIAATKSIEEVHVASFKTTILFCCAGLLLSIGLMTFGIDLGAGWI